MVIRALEVNILNYKLFLIQKRNEKKKLFFISSLIFFTAIPPSIITPHHYIITDFIPCYTIIINLYWISLTEVFCYFISCGIPLHNQKRIHFLFPLYNIIRHYFIFIFYNIFPMPCKNEKPYIYILQFMINNLTTTSTESIYVCAGSGYFFFSFGLIRFWR